MRETCTTCFRPTHLCLCARIPTVHNRTSIIVLQHKRERFHPFGSARMLMQALSRGRLEVVYGNDARSLHHPMNLPPDAGLLYPHPDAQLLHELPADEQPGTLVLLDGTWAHANRIYKDNPWLKALPHYAIAPQRKSRYLVRQEPEDHCLSTLEAAVEALQGLESGLLGLNELLDVFEQMNVEQVAQRGRSVVTPRVMKVKQRPSRRVPEALLGGAPNLVLVHAEYAAVLPDHTPSDEVQQRLESELFQIAAWRIASSGLFSAFVQPSQGEPTALYLSRADLSFSDTAARLSSTQVITELQAFLRPSDVLATWNRGVCKLLPQEVLAGRQLLQLKAAYCNTRGGPCGPLSGVVVREGLTIPEVDVPGRVGVQLREMAAVAGFLGNKTNVR